MRHQSVGVSQTLYTQTRKGEHMKLSPESLEKIEADVKELVTGTFKFSELVAVIEDMITLIRTTQTIGSPDEAIVEAKECWKYLDTKFSVVSRIDEMVALPTLLEPLDSMLISLMINSVIIPFAIKALWKL